MAMLKKLKSLFVVVEEAPTGKNDVQDNVEKPQHQKSTLSIPVNEDAKAPEKFINGLLKAIENNNLEGFDYLEYKQSLKSLENMGMDETTRFNSAFAMARTMGAQKSNLIESAQHYLNILNEEKVKFTAAFEKQMEKKVESEASKLAAIQENIRKKEAQIKKLQEEIKNSKKELEIKKKSIKESAAKVTLTRDQFYAAHGEVVDQINSDIERMEKYLTK